MMVNIFISFTIIFVTFCMASAAADDQPSSYNNGGCLAKRHPDWPKLRVCNSEDTSDAAQKGYCQSVDPDLDYLEIRIYAQNWEGAYVNAWILQILLSELLGVPATIEPGVPEVNLSFYDAQNGFGYGVSTDLEALKRTNTEPDCTKVRELARAAGEYQSCAHVIPEVWQARKGLVREYVERGEVEPAQSFLGILAGQGWYIPRFAGAADPTLGSYLGLAGEENRRKLAETFLRPTTWKQYCEEVSVNNCTVADDVARRKPVGDEGSSYFADGDFIGHFRATEENDCDKHPTSCTGHLADYFCGWGGFAKQQAYHLGIALRSKEDPNDPSSYGYSPSQMPELWAAANATRSPLMMLWYTPERLVEEFIGTDAEFHRVTLTPPTQVCVENRLSAQEKCSSVVKEQVGSELGSCDYTSEVLTKVYASGLYSTINNPDISDGSRSPAYEALQSYSVSELQINEIFGYWAQHKNQSEMGLTLRDSTCDWVVDNLEFLQNFIPRTYPRTIQKSNSVFTKPLFVISFLLACGALCTVLWTGACVWWRRGQKVIKYAQIEFLLLLILGLSFVSGGAITSAIPPSDGVCVAIVWFINFGYTLELAPLVVKIAALNRLMGASQRLRRIKVPRKNLFGISLALCGVALIYCILWTALDPPRAKVQFVITDEPTDLNETILRQDSYCDCRSSVWEFIGISWYTFLLICASAVAFQTRQLRQDFNETKTLTLMIYSHFIFTVMRLVSHLLATSQNQSVVQRYRSLLLSSDVVATVAIYFIPKLLFREHQAISRGSLAPTSTNFNSPESPDDVVSVVENIGIRRIDTSSGRRSHRISEEEVS